MTISVKGGGNGLDGTAGTLANQANLTVVDKASLTLQGAIVNSGAIALAAKTALTSLVVGKAGVTLSGAGSVNLGSNAFNTVTGAAATATLTNLDNTISGGGAIGAGKLTLVNGAAGVIDQTGSVALTIDTGTKTITNAGLIEATGDCGLDVAGTMANNGTLEVTTGTLMVTGTVSGTGTALIAGGVLDFVDGFDEAVSFTGKSGTLVLRSSQTYTSATITGFSKSGGTALDLRDIVFMNSGEATWSKATGILTVTDGAHTAQIHLSGNYSGLTFVASDDLHGGTIMVATQSGQMGEVPGGAAAAGGAATAVSPPHAPAPRAPAPHVFVAAMAAVTPAWATERLVPHEAAR